MASIKFVTPYETLSYEIEVLQNQKDMMRDRRMPELLLAQIVKEYVGYVAGRLDTVSTGWTALWKR